MDVVYCGREGLIMGMAEIAELAGGVDTQVVYNWRRRHPSFPKPFVVLKMGPVYLRTEVIEWLSQRRARKHHLQP